MKAMRFQSDEVKALDFLLRLIRSGMSRLFL